MPNPSPFLFGTLVGFNGVAGNCVIFNGSTGWVLYTPTNAGSLTGAQLGVLLDKANAGSSAPIQISGHIDPQVFNLGPGPVSAIYPGTTPVRGSGPNSLGSCDVNGIITVNQSYVGATFGQTGVSATAGSGITVVGSTITAGGTGAPLADQARLNGQTLQLVGGQDTPGGLRPVQHFDSFEASTTDALNAPRFEAMIAACSATGQDGYVRTGVYGINRPIFWTLGGVCVFGDPAPAASDFTPKFSSGTDWSGPTLVMGTDQPDPVWVGPVGAGNMYGMPLGAPGGSIEPACINLSGLDAMSLNGISTFAVDMKFFYPAGGNSGATGDLFCAAGGPSRGYRSIHFTSSSPERTRSVCF